MSIDAIGTLTSSYAKPDPNDFVMVEVAMDDQKIISTNWDNITSTCIGALYSLHYTIRFNSGGQITKAVAQIKYRNITLKQQSSNSTTLFQQFFSINFLPESANDVRRRSGNPGYIMKSAVLGAFTLSPPMNHSGGKLQYLNISESGLQVMDSGHAGQCDSASPFGTVSGHSYVIDVFLLEGMLEARKTYDILSLSVMYLKYSLVFVIEIFPLVFQLTQDGNI